MRRPLTFRFRQEPRKASLFRAQLAIAVSAIMVVAMPAAHARPPIAVGLAPSWQARRDYKDTQRYSFSPELIGFAYLPATRPRWFLRPGARLGLSGFDQPEMPSSVRLTEWDTRLSAELSLLFDGPVMPSLGVGAGLIGRSINLETRAPVTSGTDALSRFELLPWVHLQLGLGLPFGGGRLVVEPFARYELVIGDARLSWRFGLDATVALF